MSAQDSTESKKHSKFRQRFKQQRLPAWQPILTADTVLPAFFLIGLLFIPLGVALIIFSDMVQEHVIVYTDCIDETYDKPCADVIADENWTPDRVCRCKIQFTIAESIEDKVFFYYGLDNFYQNHRRYVKSRDDRQLYGKDIDTVDSNCAPYDKNGSGVIYAPCGAIANSLFNDTLVLKDMVTGKLVPVENTSIAWTSDKERKFNNPEGSTDPNDNDFMFKDTTKPESWVMPVWMLDPYNWDNNGYENEDLIVWMRTAAFPTFRKLYRRVDHDASGYLNGLPNGTYQLLIDYNYPVKSFGGGKKFIISNTSFLGGKNNFLGIAYITVGAICLILGIIFLIIHVKFGKRPAELQNISQNTPFSD